MLSTSAVIIESNSRVRSESIEPISCKTSPVLRLLLNCEFFGGMIGLDPVLFRAGRWLSEGPQVDIPVFLEKFVVANAVEAILAAPKKAVTANPDFGNKEEYGKIPGYLTKIQGDIKAEQDYILGLQQQAEDEQKTTRSMNEEERIALIVALKAKWEEHNGEYQKMAHKTLLDTESQMRHKVEIEKAMDMLEEKIALLSKGQVVVDLTE